MSEFNERFKELTSDYPYIRFLSAKVDADKFKVTVTAVYKKEYERDYLQSKNKITEVLKRMLPPSTYIEIAAAPVRLVSSEIVKECMDFLRKESVFVFSSLDKDNISVTTADDRPTVQLSLPAAVAEYAEKEKIDSRLSAHLSSHFFADFKTSFIKCEESIEQIREVLTAVVRKPKFSYERPEEGRLISPPDRTAMYGEVINGSATYIGDCIQPEFAVLYGTMTDVRIMEYSPKKPAFEGEKRKFVTFYLDDTTGKMRCVFFPGPKSQGVVKYFVDGSNIIADGWLDYDTRLNDGSLQYRVRHFTGCGRAEFEINNVVRLVDDDYRYVKPEKYVRLTQSSLYDSRSKPLTDEPLVVFQTLTTSRNRYSPGEIMEIGAVKLKNGEIVETFSSLICPHVKMEEKACFEVGLTLSDLAGKPTFEQVIPDFYKFFDGYGLTAFPYDWNIDIISPLLEKLHIPMPTLVEPFKYASVPAIKSARPKNTFRALPLAMGLAGFLVNMR